MTKASCVLLFCHFSLDFSPGDLVRKPHVDPLWRPVTFACCEGSPAQYVQTRFVALTITFIRTLAMPPRRPQYCSDSLTDQGCPLGSTCPKRHDIRRCSCGVLCFQQSLLEHMRGKRHRALLAGQQTQAPPPAPTSVPVSTLSSRALRLSSKSSP